MVWGRLQDYGGIILWILLLHSLSTLALHHKLEQVCSQCLIQPQNCSTEQTCIYCNQTTDCNSGTCISHNNLGNNLGLCEVIKGRFFSLSNDGDTFGKVIAFGILGIFLTVIILICCRIFSGAFFWKRCCLCQCTLSIQCCCEPKTPSLRIIPATGETGRNNLSQPLPGTIITNSSSSSSGRANFGGLTPPPAYLDLYPEREQPSRLSAPVHLNPEDEQNPITPSFAAASFSRQDDDADSSSDWDSIPHLNSNNSSPSHLTGGDEDLASRREEDVFEAQRIFSLQLGRNNRRLLNWSRSAVEPEEHRPTTC